MKILNLTDGDLPVLQGVETIAGKCRDQALERLADGNPPDVRAGRIRDAVSDAANWRAYIDESKDGSWIEAIANEVPHLVVLPRGQAEVAQAICMMQIGPEPGTRIPLMVPVEARNRQWLYAGTKSEVRIPVAFEIDQNGNVVGLANFVHRTPPITTGQIEPA